MTDYSYIGSGKIYLKIVGASAGLVHVGNCSSLKFNIANDKKKLKDYTKPGGGIYNSVTRIESVEAALSVHDLSAANLAIALYGTASAIAAGALVDEQLVGCYKGGFNKTLFPIDTTVAPVITSSPAGTTYVSGTDYTVTESGVEWLSTATFTDAATLLIDYTKKAGNAVEALLTSAQEYQLVFAGLNEARSGKAVSVEAYRVKFDPAQVLDLIGDDFGVLEIVGEVLKDTTKNGTTVSQYFHVQVVT